MENNEIIKNQSKSSRVAEWTIMLFDTLLFSSALNCLFQMLAYSFTKAFDIALFISSLALALFVHFYSMNIKKNPVLKNRFVAAISSVVIWALLIPLISIICK